MTLVTAVYGYDLTDKNEEHALMEQEFLEGVIGMKPGGRRLLMVPPVFADGYRGRRRDSAELQSDLACRSAFC
jgi:hypothetical protein